nr:MAG TPA: hypothetical protein [Caudoviricetes sp.]
MKILYSIKIVITTSRRKRKRRTLSSNGIIQKSKEGI